MITQKKKLNRTLVVRITESQYLMLLESIINENKKSSNQNVKPLDKSKIIRDMLENRLK